MEIDSNPTQQPPDTNCYECKEPKEDNGFFSCAKCREKTGQYVKHLHKINGVTKNYPLEYMQSRLLEMGRETRARTPGITEDERNIKDIFLKIDFETPEVKALPTT
jgi:hypothetical protein